MSSEESKMDNSTQDTKGQHHELFLQEIEGIDEYWGPTFRYVFASLWGGC